MDPAIGSALLNLTGTVAAAGAENNQARKNRNSQERQNKLDIFNNWQMWRANRMASVLDWNRQNDYNSPVQQMQRLKEGGLNPNLVYGNGADVTAGPINTPSGSMPTHTAPTSNVDYSFLSSLGDSTIGAYQDAAIKTQQLDNLKLQSDLLSAKTSETRVDIANKAITGDRSKFELDKMRELRDTSILYETLRTKKQAAEITNIGIQQQFKARELQNQTRGLDIKQADLELSFKRFDLQKAKTNKDIERISSDIILNYLRAKNVEVDTSKKEVQVALEQWRNLLVQNELKLKQLGITPGTPEYRKRYLENMEQGASILDKVVKILK